MVKVFNKTLLKRAPREYKKEYFKFLILQICLVITILLISGYLMGTRAVDDSYFRSLSTFHVEDGEFSTFYRFGDENIKTMEEKYDLNIEENSYYNIKFVNKNDVDNYTNIYTNRQEINQISVTSGRLPSAVDEILLEQTYADYNHYDINESISIGDCQFKIVGKGHFSDYPSIKKSDSDIAFKYKEFLLGYVTNETFSEFDVNDVTFSYSYRFNKELNVEEKETVSGEMKDTVVELAKSDTNFMIKFTPMSENKNINTPKNYAAQYTVIVLTFFYILIVILAFVFSINTVSRIIEESKVIGTLRANGITRLQLVAFYLLLPLFVILSSSIVGNLIGYYAISPFFANIFMEMFSFDLIPIPFYWDLFLLTTVVPSVILFAISALIVMLTIRKPISKFLNGEIEHASQKGTRKLAVEKRFSARLRERIFLKNTANYVFLFIGILFGSIFFTLGIALKTSTDHQIDTTIQEAFCENMYLLKLPIECSDENVEKFGIYSFDYRQAGYRDCTITMYGLEDESKYVDIDFSNYEKDTVYISSAFREKYDVDVNDQLTFFDSNSKANVNYKVAGVYDYYSSACLFAPIRVTSALIYENRVKPSEAAIERILNYYGISYDLKGIIVNGYFSDHPLNEFADEYIESIITPESLKEDATMMVRIYNVISILAVAAGTVTYVLMMFLLTRHLMDKNTKNIVLFKILGMTNTEIRRDFNIPSFIVLNLSLLVAMPITRIFSYLYETKVSYKTMLQFVRYAFPVWIYPVCFGIGLASFVVIMLVSKAKIKKTALINLYKL